MRGQLLYVPSKPHPPSQPTAQTERTGKLKQGRNQNTHAYRYCKTLQSAMHQHIILNITSKIRADFLPMNVILSNNAPQNIADTLGIRGPGSIENVDAILKVLVDKNMTDWNNDNYVWHHCGIL